MLNRNCTFIASLNHCSRGDDYNFQAYISFKIISIKYGQSYTLVRL